MASIAATADFIDHAAWRPKHNPYVIAVTVTLATFMEVLDTSIANIALPHIAGTFGASTDESTWVLTSYLVSNGIVLPISAWLATRLGRKRYYMSCVALFAASSFLCGLAPSLGMLVFFRILQGYSSMCRKATKICCHSCAPTASCAKCFSSGWV